MLADRCDEAVECEGKGCEMCRCEVGEVDSACEFPECTGVGICCVEEEAVHP